MGRLSNAAIVGMLTFLTLICIGIFNPGGLRELIENHIEYTNLIFTTPILMAAFYLIITGVRE